MKKRKKGGMKKNPIKERDRRINGIITRFIDDDPLGDNKYETLDKLPFSHLNPSYIPAAKYYFNLYHKYIFSRDFNWKIHVTPISKSDKPMRDTVIYSAFCHVDYLTDAVEDYIESVLMSMNDLELEFLKTWKFECRIKL